MGHGMIWQELGVLMVVVGAVLFLARRLFPSATPARGTTTFVPLSSVKPRRDPPGCH